MTADPNQKGTGHMQPIRITRSLVASLMVASTLVGNASAQDANPEQWIGTLDVGAIKLRIRLEISTDDDGSSIAKVFSLDQGNVEIGVTSFKRDGKTLEFALASVGASFKGTMNQDGAFEGTFTQLGKKFPLAFKKTDKVEEPNRPQQPKPPFPYEIREVEVENEQADGVTLAGTLTLPEGDGPFPAVILVSGSGPQDRNESLMGHEPFHVIADHLSRNGIAVLRYDDRGFGKSTGNFGTSTSEDFASDAEAVLRFLSMQVRIDSERLGLIGHSEGGLIGSMLAARNDQLAHAILLAGPGVNGDKIIRTQTKAMADIAGVASEEDLDLVGKALDAVKGGASAQDLINMADEYFNNHEPEAGEDAETIQIEKQTTKMMFAQFASPWFRYFLKYDPAADLKQANCPILAMVGAKDLQVVADVNLPPLKEALKQAPVQGHRVERLEGLNHLFQTAKTGAATEYGSIEETFSPQALAMITDWIKTH